MAKKQKEDGKAMAMPVDEDGKEGKLLSVNEISRFSGTACQSLLRHRTNDGFQSRRQLELKDNEENRVSFGGGGGSATKRVSWNRSLSTRLIHLNSLFSMNSK
ncbi:hypothetical protein Peur_027296 [Populus x canadensis]